MENPFTWVFGLVRSALASLAAPRAKPASTMTRTPNLYFSVMYDSGSTDNVRFTTEPISMVEARELLTGGKLVNLGAEEWEMVILTLRTQATIMMSETVSLAAFMPGDQMLIAHFTRKDPEAEPAYENVVEAELSFALGTFH